MHVLIEDQLCLTTLNIRLSTKNTLQRIMKKIRQSEINSPFSHAKHTPKERHWKSN